MNRLEGLHSIYYINLSDQKDRRESFENQCKQYNINPIRIEAIDGRNLTKQDMVDKYVHQWPTPYFGVDMTTKELACTLSHLYAIKYWLDHSVDEEWACIAEDDSSFETVDNWKFTWKDVVEHIPYHCDLLQLSVSMLPEKTEPMFHMHQRRNSEFSTTCYLINRWYAIKLMKIFLQGDKFYLSQIYPYARAEEVLYRGGVVYNFPIFTFYIHYPSTIQTQEHVDYIHQYSRNLLIEFWKQSYLIEDKNSLFSHWL